MSVVVLLPLLVLAAVLVAVVVAGSRAMDEFALLKAELQRVGQLRPALVEVTDRASAMRAAAARLRR